MKYIDPEKPDPFNPSNLYQEDMQFIEKKKPSTEEQQPQILAQIDLTRIRMRSGCRLGMFDIIISCDYDIQQVHTVYKREVHTFYITK